MMQESALPTQSNVIHMAPASDQPRGLFDMPRCTFTSTGLIIERGMPLDDWVELGKRLQRAKDSLGIWVGDYVEYGKHEYGKKYEAALALTGYAEGTLRNYVSVAKAVPLSLRNDKFKYHHYEVVAPLRAKDKIKRWLKKALHGDGKRIWSAARLKKEMTKASNPTDGKQGFAAELTKLHSKIAREELDEKIRAVDKWLETAADPLLSSVYRKLKEILKWQRDRNLESDCAAIMKVFAGDVGTEAPERVSDEDLTAWLRARGYIMSKEEIGQAGFPARDIQPSGRIGLMLRLKMLTVESREESRGETQRGVITHVYAAHRDYLGHIEDTAELEAAERTAARRKDWRDRIAKYAPELMPPKEPAV